MTTKTRIDLVNEALFVLGISAAGQTAAAEDFQRLDACVDAAVDSLDKRDIVTVDDIDAIPGEWFHQLAVIVADRAAQGMGVAGVPTTAANPDPVAKAIMELRETEYTRPTYESQRGNYF